MNSGPSPDSIHVYPEEWEYAEQFLSDAVAPWKVGSFNVCPIPSYYNTNEETDQHAVLREYRTQNIGYVTINHEFIKAGDELYAMPNAYEIENNPALQQTGGQGAFSCLLSRDNPNVLEWGVKKISKNAGHPISEKQIALAEFATRLCVGPSYPIITRYQNNLIHYYHIQLRAPGDRLADLIRFKRELGYYLSAISLIRIVRKLHVNGIIHRDIKPKNVMLWQSRVDPFGMGLIDNDPDCLHEFDVGNDVLYTSNRIGTPGYMAPEVIRSRYQHQRLGLVNGHRYSFKSDVYALGITFLESFGVTSGSYLRSRFKALPSAYEKNLAPLEQIFIRMVADDYEARPNLTTALVDVIVEMHQKFNDETLEDEAVRLTLEQCSVEVLDEARTTLANSGIRLALPEPETNETSSEVEIDPLFEPTKPAFLPMFTKAYIPTIGEAYEDLIPEPMDGLVREMERCRLF